MAKPKKAATTKADKPKVTSVKQAAAVPGTLAPETIALAHKLREQFPDVAVRKGVSYTPEQDILLAHGWPYLRVLIDDHPDDADVEGSTLAALDDTDTYHVEWPRKVAELYCKTIGTRKTEDLGKESDLKRALKAKGTATTDARKWIAHSLSFSGSVLNRRHVEHFVFLNEALIGAEPTLDAIAAGLEANGRGSSSDEAADHALLLGFLLRRVKPAVAKKQRARLAKLYESLTGKGRDDWFLRNLSIVLGGAKAARAKAMNPAYWIDVTDDPAAVADSLKAGRWTPTIRNVYLAGVDSIELVTGTWKKNWRYEKEQAWFLEQLTWLRSPKVRSHIEVMAASSLVKTKAKAWLAANPK